MIEYIILSYVFMFLLTIYSVTIWDGDLRECIKWWIFSPISMPIFIICYLVER